MTSRFKQRWFMAGAVWLAAIMISCWNFAKIDSVATVRENSEKLRKEYAFQNRNADKLLRIQKLHRSFYKPVPSLKLGFESIRSPLKALAALFGMKNVLIEHQIARATPEQIPFTMGMRGNYQKAMGFASALLKYPYISIAHSRILVLNETGDAEIELELVFQIKIKPPHTPGQDALQASARPLDQEVLHQ